MFESLYINMVSLFYGENRMIDNSGGIFAVFIEKAAGFRLSRYKLFGRPEPYPTKRDARR